MDKRSMMINSLLKDTEIAMIPHHPNPDEELKSLYDYFNGMNVDALYRELLPKHNEYGFENALNIVKHYKGLFNHFDSGLEFSVYQKIKPWLNDESKKKYRVHFYKDYAKEVLVGNLKTIDEGLLEMLLNNDIHLYSQVARKLKLVGAGAKIFEKAPGMIYNWLNSSENVYMELINLDQPEFILRNMNGKLDVSDGALKYIIEKAEPSLELFISIKKNIGMAKLWELSNFRFAPEFYVDLVENMNDLLFVINIENIGLNSLEIVFSKIKEKFPHLYDNFNSLLFVKKEFNNK